MENYILISQLNSFEFCPYSIYLHNIYKEQNAEANLSAAIMHGCLAHESVDTKSAFPHTEVLLAMPVYSDFYGIMGKIDVFYLKSNTLVEWKNELRHIFQGHLYQLWAQMFCLCEMGYHVEHLAFYEVSKKRTIPQPLPTKNDEARFADFVKRFKTYDPLSSPVTINLNKCRHCVYSNLCDKTDFNNDYS